MRKLKNGLQSTFKKMKSTVSNRRGQGMVEYILLLVVVVALVMVFKDKIKSTVQGKIEQLGTDIGNFGGN